jgi:hypothetical protein
MGMGASGDSIDMSAQRDEIVRSYFEPQLERIGLSLAQIERQNLNELKESLAKVNDAIANSEGFGTLKLNLSANVGLFVTQSRQEALIEVAILPLLLERKSLILRRIRNLSDIEKERELSALVERVEDPELREKIHAELSQTADETRRAVEQESAVAEAQARQIEQRDRALAQLRTELLERRLRAWRGFFARESMATYIGAILLIVLTGIEAWVLVSGTSYKSEIINNAYLLLLGFFFGQNATRGSPGENAASQ